VGDHLGQPSPWAVMNPPGACAAPRRALDRLYQPGFRGLRSALLEVKTAGSAAVRGDDPEAEGPRFSPRLVSFQP
jgi:hypothetical protein